MGLLTEGTTMLMGEFAPAVFSIHGLSAYLPVGQWTVVQFYYQWVGAGLQKHIIFVKSFDISNFPTPVPISSYIRT